jgi:hypothetical protein
MRLSKHTITWFPHLALPLEAPLEYPSETGSARGVDFPYPEVVP